MYEVNRKYTTQFAVVNKPLVSKISLSKSVLSLAYLFISAHWKVPVLNTEGPHCNNLSELNYS